jgi:hypothetical protein
LPTPQLKILIKRLRKLERFLLITFHITTRSSRELSPKKLSSICQPIIRKPLPHIFLSKIREPLIAIRNEKEMKDEDKYEEKFSLDSMLYGEVASQLRTY